MKKIRRNVFETNSSSSHSVTIYKDRDSVTWHKSLDLDMNWDDRYEISFGEFGWGPDTYCLPNNKLSYLVTMIAMTSGEYPWCCNESELKEIIERVENHEDFLELSESISSYLRSNGDYCKGLSIKVEEGYIDHQSYEYYSNLQDFLDDYGVSAEEFVFNPAIVLEIDNDNH